MFKNIKYLSMPTSDLSTRSVNAIVEKLYSETIENHMSSDKFAVQLQLKVNGLFRSISKIQVVSLNEKEQLKSVLSQYIHQLYSHYQEMDVSDMFIRYCPLSPNDPKAKISLKGVSENIKNLPLVKPNLPPSIDLNSWGSPIQLSSNNFLITGNFPNTLYSVEINKIVDSTTGIVSELRKILVIDKTSHVVLFKFEDYIPDITKNMFTRTLDTQNIIKYNGNEQIMYYPKRKPAIFIPSLNKDNNCFAPFVTLDLETCKMENGNLFIESAAIYDGKTPKSFHIMDYTTDFGDTTSGTSLLKDVLDYLIQVNIKQNSKNKDKLWRATIIYIHNFSKFDAIFLVRFFVIESSLFKIISRDGTIISITFHKKVIINNKHVTIKLIFRDSYLIMNGSLSALAKTFKTVAKGGFDTSLIKEGYDRSFYRDELLRYNELDCIVLYNIITKFSKQIFRTFHINMHKYSTSASLTFGIWQTGFLDDKVTKIAITDVQLYDKLRPGYTGGAVDVFSPTNKDNKIVYGYDINSMYPAVMHNYDFPVGPPIFFEGKKDLLADNLFGFLRVKIVAPLNIKTPLLQVRIGNKTISGVGSWEGVYFSEELKLALQMGYSIEVISGVLFNRKPIFRNFVDKLYNMRISHKKGTPMNMLCKLLLNSLYGKFGMNPRMSEGVVESLSNASSKDYFPDDFITINDELNINFYQKVFNKSLDYNNEEEYKKMLCNSLLISLPISSAVTAYSRIELFKYKESVGDGLLYTDTDSIFTTTPLPSKFIGSGLGQMKLEYTAIKAIFIAPKVYGLVLLDGTEIVKIKGSKKGHGITVSYLETLLLQEKKIEIKQDKWYRDLSESLINIRSTIYTLKVTENKRQLVYKDGIFADTNPLLIENGNIISPSVVNIITANNSFILVNSVSKSIINFKPLSLVLYSPNKITSIILYSSIKQPLSIIPYS